MRLRAEVAALVVFAAVVAPGAMAQRAGAPPTRAEVERALEEVALDPNLVPERTVRMLRFVADEPASAEESWWGQWWQALARWVRGLFGWLAESGRYLVWTLGAIAAAWLAIYLVRLIGGRGLPRVPQPAAPPSHVRDLDIRPQSLPEDVGAEAQRLWNAGEQRAALALLYRGLLSRLAHVHGVPVRASSTEGECVALARPRLGARASGYVERLVAVWQAAVYGGVPPGTAAVAALCGEFAAALELERRTAGDGA